MNGNNMRICQTLRQKLMPAVLTLLLAGIILAACVVKGETMPTFSGRVWLDSNTYLVGGNGQPIVLVNNPNASNPMLLQLLDFVRSDQTDKIPYSSAFVCADFAETLYNSAESQGIKAAYIVLRGVHHTINAFQTTDAGLIFIDCTGESSQVIPQINTAYANTLGEASGCDKVAYIESGKPLGVISLDAAASHYGFSYSGYEQWEKDKELFDTELDSYNRQVNGRLFVPQLEYDQLQEEFHSIDLLENQLGAFWEEAGVVQSYQIFWEGK